MSWSEKLSITLARKIIPDGGDFTVGQVSHGIEIFILYVFNFVFLFAVAALFHFFSYALLLAIFYMMTRNFTGGIHFKSATLCFLTGNAVLLLIAYLIQNLSTANVVLAYLIVNLAIAIAFLINWRYAPSEHTYVSITDEVKQRNRKIVLGILIIGCIFSEFMLYYSYFHLPYCFGFAVLLQSVFLHPLSYKVIGFIETNVSRKE